jgi:tRNA (guanine-N7-)-methyltransferase
VRKPRRFTPEELAPFQWQMPKTRRSGAWGVGAEPAEGTEPEAQTAAPVPPPPPIDWAALFGNPNPVEVEVGMGKGLFLLNSAVGRPDTNFFGIEIVRKYQLYATSRFAVRELKNAKTVCAAAGWVFQNFIATASVSAVHVYFPDPWWKAKHKKRRVFSPQFAAEAARITRVGGKLLIATDVEEYFGVMTGIVRAMPAYRELGSETSTGTLEEAGYQTNFERKARQKGTPVWRAQFERTAEPVTVAADPAA